MERITDLRRSFGVQANGLKLSFKGMEKHFQFGFANLHVCPRLESYAGLSPLLRSAVSIVSGVIRDLIEFHLLPKRRSGDPQDLTGPPFVPIG